MIEKLIDKSVRQPLFVTIVVLIGIAWGLYALKHTPLDAIPDLSDPQVILFTEWMGRSPDIIEDQITYPLVSSMVALPHVTSARGYSMFGMSFIYLLFEEGTDLYWARSRVNEYLSKIRGKLPEGVNPELGPDASGVGWVLSYSLVDESGKNRIEDLRTFQDYKLKYLLESVSGVAEVASVGGFVVQYQVQVNPNALAQYGITLKEVMDKVQKSNRDVGGRVLEMSEREYFIRGHGYIQSIADIENIMLKTSENGESILIKHIGHVARVPDIRRGAVDLDGGGEAVSGIVVARYGTDVLGVIRQVKETLHRLEPSLPEGVKIQITYDRSRVIERSVATLWKELQQEVFIVALIIFVFLWHFRSMLVPVILLPVAILLAFIPIYHLGVTANIMSLAGIAIAIGDMVDAAIVLVENAHKKLESWNPGKDTRTRMDVLVEACREVGRPIFYSLLVIAIAFLPIMALEGQEGRLFKPLAFTKNFSMFFAAILAVTLGPVLVVRLLGEAKPVATASTRFNRIFNFFWVGRLHNEEHHPVSRFLHRLYLPVLDFVLRHRARAMIVSLLLVLSVVPVYFSLGQEFMPPLNEGDLLYMPTTLPGISIGKAREWLQQQDKIIKKFKEVESVFGKVGRAETPTDPAPLSMAETVVQLHPQENWPDVFYSRWYSNVAPEWLKPALNLVWPEHSPRTWERLVEDLNAAVQLPGTTNAWVFPIRTRIDMLTTGIRTPVGIKVFGDDLERLEQIATRIETLTRDLPGTRSVIADRSLGGYYLDIKIRRDALASYGMTIENANRLIEGVIGGMTVTTIVDGRARYPVSVRYQRDFRDDIEKLKRSLITVMPGRHIPLLEIADVSLSTGPAMIKDENGLITTWVYVDLNTGTDMQGFVDELEGHLRESGLFPPGYTYKISGQFEFWQHAKDRLMLLIPLTLALITLLIYINTGSWIRVAIVLLAVPFSMVGAFWLLYLLGYKVSIAVWVGLIALAGIDAETGVMMLLYLDLAYDSKLRQGGIHTTADLVAVIHEGAVKRVRPKLMTVLVNIIGLMPIMWASSHETGADVAKRIAAPLVGGITTSFIMELLIYPCLYLWWKGRKL